MDRIYCDTTESWNFLAVGRKPARLPDPQSATPRLTSDGGDPVARPTPAHQDRRRAMVGGFPSALVRACSPLVPALSSSLWSPCIPSLNSRTPRPCARHLGNSLRAEENDDDEDDEEDLFQSQAAMAVYPSRRSHGPCLPSFAISLDGEPCFSSIRELSISP